MTTKLKGDAAGGLLDSLINKGELPTVKIQIEQETLIKLGLMIIISISIVVMLNQIFKQIFTK